MSADIKELVHWLRMPGHNQTLTERQRHAADALEAMAGEVYDLEARCETAEKERDRLRAVLEKIAVGDYERSGRIYYINKLRPSKNDVCEHSRAFWDDCGNCCSNFARKALGGDATWAS